LTEAKALVESAPKPVKEGLPKALFCSRGALHAHPLSLRCAARQGADRGVHPQQVIRLGPPHRR
jgi:hypothetical protein